MTFIVRPAALADIRQMAEIAGSPVTPAGLADWMDGDSAYAAWHLVETEQGRVLGFQQIGRSESLPVDACEIATFFGKTALPAGAAGRLFDATAGAARLLRYLWISATLARDNDAAQTYYQSQGFRRYGDDETRILMRFDLE